MKFKKIKWPILICSNIAISFLATNCSSTNKTDEKEKIKNLDNNSLENNKKQIQNNNDSINELMRDNKIQTQNNSSQNPNTTNVWDKEKTSYSEQELKEIIKDKALDELFEVKISRLTNNDKSETLASSLTNNNPETLVVSELSLEIKDPKITYEIIGKTSDDEKGILNIGVTFGKSGEILKSYQISGFKKQKPQPSLARPQVTNDELTKYFKNLDINQQFDHDWQKIKQSAENNIGARDLKITQEQKNQINSKLSSLNIPDYDQLNTKGVTLPEYVNGEIKLNIRPNANPAIYNWTDHLGKQYFENTGLARTIVNETYSKIAKQTYNINFTKWDITGDNNEQIEIKKLLEIDLDLGSLINLLKDTPKKVELQKAWEKAKKNKDTWKKFKESVEEQLIADYQGEKDENNKNKEDVLYTQWINQERQKIITKVNNSSQLKQETKQRLVKLVNNTTNFFFLQGAARSTNGQSGTASIIDYQLPDDPTKYPTKFYFITNYHVIDGMTRDGEFFFSYKVLEDNGDYIGNALKTTTFEPNIKSYTIGSKAYKNIWDGRDFFKFNPTQISSNAVANSQDFLDAAIFEVDFSKVENLYGMTPEEFAKKATNNYANLKDDDKLKFANYDYLSNYDKIDAPLIKDQPNKKDRSELDSIYAVSYPKSTSKGFDDFFLDVYKDSAQYSGKTSSFSLWFNKDASIYNKFQQGDEKNKYGGWLSHSNILTTFKDKRGVFDRFLTHPILDSSIYISKDDAKPYYNAGLGYAMKNYNIGGGASGSSLRNQDNKLMGLITTGFSLSYVSTGVSVRSVGKDLNGAFGSYNIPQYDAIYGTGKDQNSSYVAEMQKLYGNSNVKTYLFKDGLNTIPDEFKFK